MKKNFRRNYFFAGGALMTLSGVWVFAQGNLEPLPITPDPIAADVSPEEARKLEKEAREWTPPGLNFLERHYGWVNQTWTGDSAPYQKVLAEIDKAIFTNQKPAQISAAYEQYKAQAKAKPKDALAQFAWAQAAYKTARINPTLADAKLKGKSQELAQRKLILPVLEALRGVEFPRIYEFARLRFLLESFDSPSSELNPVAKRLLAQNSKDYRVMFYYLRDPNMESASDRKQALGYAQTLIRLDAKKPEYIAALAATYAGIAAITDDEKAKTQAIAGYERYLRVTSVDEPFRADAKRLISWIKSW